VQEVADRLGVSSHSLYKWLKAVRPSKNEQRSEELLAAKKEILKLRAELRRVEEERVRLRTRPAPTEGIVSGRVDCEGKHKPGGSNAPCFYARAALSLSRAARVLMDASCAAMRARAVPAR